jgi:ligand-binding sensor domain-containing protein/DNA-binding NarL/FixJ family response regulator
MTAMLRVGLSTLLCIAPARAERYRFRHFGPDEGLNTAVNRIVQDRQGFLWVATGNGLFRFDGAGFNRFGTEEGLPRSSIRSMAEAPDGTLWVLTGRGLARSHGNTFEILDAGPVEQDVRTLEISPRGDIYLGLDRGLLHSPAVAGSMRPEFTPVAEAPAQAVNGIHTEADGKVWFNCGLKLCLLEQSHVQVFDEAAGLPPERWAAMLRDRAGTLWVRGPRHLSVLVPGAGRFVSRDDGLAAAGNYGVSLLEERQGYVLATSDEGLARWTGERWQTIGIAQGLESDAVTSLFQDREGSLWIGMWGAGIARWPSPGQWTNWTTADGLPNPIVWAVRRQGSNLWVGTDRGLVRFDEGFAAKTWVQKNGLAGDRVKALAIAPDGAVWAASNPGGISRIDPVTLAIRSYGASSGLTDDRVNAIHIGPDERLWASTADGLFRSTGLGPNLRFERETPPAGKSGVDQFRMPEHTVYMRFATDREGHVWIATAKGLLQWDQGKWTRITAADGLRGDELRTVLATDDGSIWVAYREPLGLSRVTFAANGLNIEHVTKGSGLPSDYVLFLGLDARRQMWVGTDNGVAAGAPGHWKIWTHEDGLLSDDCASNAFLADVDGTVWVGTLKGLSHFKAQEKTAPEEPAPAVITSVFFAEHGRDPAAFAIVPFADNDFRVSFAGPTFLSERNVRFRYRLAGLDVNWIEGTQRETRYASLPAGDYRFEVQARTGSGPWTAQAASIGFRIVVPWWQTWWFRVAVAVAIGALCFLMLRFHVRLMRRGIHRLVGLLRERTAKPDTGGSVNSRRPQEAVQPIALPVAPVQRARVSPTREPARLRVLLAEDNPVNQKLAQRAIEKMGHAITVVSNGAEAVRVHAAGRFDLVLMDLQMPEMDGFAATSAIRESDGGATHTSIVAMTAHAMHGDRERCLAAGMDDYISKPIDLKALANLIERVGQGSASVVTEARGPVASGTQSRRLVDSLPEHW